MLCKILNVDCEQCTFLGFLTTVLLTDALFIYFIRKGKQLFQTLIFSIYWSKWVLFFNIIILSCNFLIVPIMGRFLFDRLRLISWSQWEDRESKCLDGFIASEDRVRRLKWGCICSLSLFHEGNYLPNLVISLNLETNTNSEYCFEPDM